MSTTKNNPEEEFPGYPSYPASDDIFIKGKELSDIDPENILKKKAPNLKPGEWNEKDFDDIKSGDDLDIPGEELDDAEELIGEEDEENNYYSIGGDNHDNLEENNDP